MVFTRLARVHWFGAPLSLQDCEQFKVQIYRHFEIQSGSDEGSAVKWSKKIKKKSENKSRAALQVTGGDMQTNQGQDPVLGQSSTVGEL